MRQILVLIDGMSGGGKTTAAHLLAERLPRTAIIGFDRIKKFVSDFERGPRDNQIAREVTMVMARKYLDLGLSVIVEHPFKTEDEIEFYSALAAKQNIPCYKFQLHTDPEIALQRVMERTKMNSGDLTEERARQNISLFQPRNHIHFSVIDTTDLAPERIVQIIFDEIRGT